MVKKQAATSRSVEPSETDNLKLINGIGPAVEHRLHGIGIYTFAQLAALSPADIAAAIAGLSGLTAKRIAKQDWIGQASRLAASSKSTEKQEAEETEPAHPVEQEPELTATIAQEAEFPPPAIAEPVLAIATPEETTDTDAPVEEAESVPPVLLEPEIATQAVTSPGAKDALITPSVVAMRGPIGVLRILKMEMIQAEAQALQNILRHDQPYTVCLTLDLTDVVMSADIQFNYKAYILCKSLEGNPPYVAGEATGTITYTDSITINVKGTALPRGSILLQALVTLWQVRTETTQQTYLQAWSDGNLLLVI